MNESTQRVIRKFNPGTFQSDKEVIDQFVVRKKELNFILETLRNNLNASCCQHVLIVAPRGRGKTMLLARVAAELRTSNKLAGSLLPVQFMEENHEIFDMASFWLETLFHLARETSGINSEFADELRKTYADLPSRWQGATLEEHAYAAVLEAINYLDRKLVLMVENMQSLCNNTDDDFGWKLRAALQSEPHIMLLATATSHFEGLEDVQEPFFELFRTIDLKRLDTEDCRLLWQEISGDTVDKREIRPLQILTGGSPRLLVIVGEFAQHRSLLQLMENLMKLVDDHTEYFRGHLEILPDLERRVYLAIIDLWQESSASEIATRSRIEIRKVSTMLGRLVRRGAIIMRKDGKKSLYVAAERLYSIYYKLRRERDEAAIVQSLIYFMAMFYNKEELVQMSGRLSREARKYPAIQQGIERAITELSNFAGDASDILRPNIQALVQSIEVDDKEIEYQLVEIVEAFKEGAYEKVVEVADPLISHHDIDLLPVPELIAVGTLLVKAIAHEQLDDPDKAIEIYDVVLDKFGGSNEPDIQEWIALVLFCRGDAQNQLNEYEAAISFFDEVLERFGDNGVPEIQRWVAMSQVCKGDAQASLNHFEKAGLEYDEVVHKYCARKGLFFQSQVARALVGKAKVMEALGDLKAATKACDEVIKRFSVSDKPEIQKWLAAALVGRGNLRGGHGDYEAAIADFDQVVNGFSDTPDFQWPVATALVKRGDAREELGDHQAAIASYDEAIVRFNASEEPSIQKQVALALVGKGDSQIELDNHKAAIVSYDEVIARFDASDLSEIQGAIVSASVGKGDSRRELGDYEAAIASYDEVIARFGTSDELGIQEKVASALVGKGDSRRELGDYEAAIASYDEVIEKFDSNTAPIFRWRIATALMGKGGAQSDLGDFGAAVEAYEEVVKRLDTGEEPEFQWMIAMALRCKGEVQEELGDIQAALAVYDEIVKRYADTKAPDLHECVIDALLSKGTGLIRIGQPNEALHICEKLDRRLKTFSASDADVGYKWDLACLRTKALFTQGEYKLAMDAFHAAYVAFRPDNEIMMREILPFVVDLIVCGASEHDLIEVLLGDSEKSEALDPLVVALRQHSGEKVRAPDEVLDVAGDICKDIEEKKEKEMSSVSGVS